MKRKVKRHTPPTSDDPAYCYLPLTRGLNALVPAELCDWLNEWNWCARKADQTFYAMRYRQMTDGSGTATIHLHNVIWEKLHGSIPPTVTVDHINRNGLTTCV